jgi:hypothetical protein
MAAEFGEEFGCEDRDGLVCAILGGCPQKPDGVKDLVYPADVIATSRIADALYFTYAVK